MFSHQQQQQHMLESNTSRQISIYFLDGSHFSITTSSTDTNLVELICAELKLPSQFRDRFSLYMLVHDQAASGANQWKLFRKLYQFESGHVALRRNSTRQRFRLCFMRNYWDPALDQLLLQSTSGMNLLFAEASSMFKRGWILGRNAKEHTLLAHFIQEDVESFLGLVRAQQYFSCFQFGPMYW